MDEHTMEHYLRQAVIQLMRTTWSAETGWSKYSMNFEGLSTRIRMNSVKLIGIRAGIQKASMTRPLCVRDRTLIAFPRKRGWVIAAKFFF